MVWGYFRYRYQNGYEGMSREGGIVFIKEGFVVLWEVTYQLILRQQDTPPLPTIYVIYEHTLPWSHTYRYWVPMWGTGEGARTAVRCRWIHVHCFSLCGLWRLLFVGNHWMLFLLCQISSLAFCGITVAPVNIKCSSIHLRWYSTSIPPVQYRSLQVEYR